MEPLLRTRLKTFKALSDKSRLAILDLLIKEEKCACEISEELSLAQSKAAYHLKILCECGLVQFETSGKYTHYSVSERTREQIFSLLALLESDVSEEHEVEFCYVEEAAK